MHVSVGNFVLASLGIIDVTISYITSGEHSTAHLHEHIVKAHFSMHSPISSTAKQPLSSLVRLSTLDIKFSVSILIAQPPQPLPSAFLKSAPLSFTTLHATKL